MTDRTQELSAVAMSVNAMVKLIPGPEAVGAARQAVTDAADGHVGDDCLETLRLLVSEVVTNTVRHSGTANELEVAFCVNSDAVVSVTDHGVGFAPRPRTGATDEVGGWGLYLVEQLSSEWGVARNGFTKVWFVVPAA
jgi:anti-sigma regulatory factor (Ser/Thr protein kinase)